MTVRLTPLSLDDGMPMDAWQRARRLQLIGSAPLVNLDGDRGGAYPAPQDSMGIDDWIRSRDWQAGGGSTIPEDLAPTRMAVLSQAQMPVTGVTVIGKPVAAKPAVTPARLTGPPGMAERIANSLNAIAAGPNTSAPIHEEGGRGQSRGALAAIFASRGKRRSDACISAAPRRGLWIRRQGDGRSVSRASGREYGGLDCLPASESTPRQAGN